MSKLTEGYGSTSTKDLLGKMKNYILSKVSTKQDQLTFDNSPTQNSANPVKSGGIWTSLQEIGLSVSALQASVLLKATDSAVVHNTDNETIGGTKTFSAGVIAKGNGLNTNTIATDPDTANTSIDVDASLNVTGGLDLTGKLQMADGSSKGYAELGIGSSSAEFKLKKSPTDNVTPVDIKAENLSQYMGTSQTPYVMQMGTHGVKTDNIKISSDGNMELSGDLTVNGTINGKKGGTIYGMFIDGNEDDCDEKVKYLYDAVNMIPAHMDYTAGKFDYGSWGNAFFMPKPCMLKYDGTVDYYLYPDDFTKKADGTESDVDDTTYGGNAMIEWGQNGKKIWVKVIPKTNDPTSATILIADHQADDDFHAWSFINMHGELVDHFYTPIYPGSNIDSRMRSLSGITYTNYIKNLSRQEEVAYAEVNNPGTDKLWYTEVVADNDLITFLLMLMAKSTDTQEKYGEGRTGLSWSESNLATTGLMDKKGMFYGETNNQGIGVKVFGMEHFWGNQWRAEAGLINDNGAIKKKMTYGEEDGSTHASYNFDGTEYITVANITPSGTSGGYIDKAVFDPIVGIVPYKASGSDQQDYSDGLWFNNSQNNYALRGGDLSVGRRCGAFCVSLFDTPSVRGRDIGAALSCKPRA